MEGHLESMSEDEQLALAMKESLESYEHEKSPTEKPKEQHSYYRSGDDTEDADLARALQESLNETGGRQTDSDNVWSWGTSQAPPSDYQRHQGHDFYPTRIDGVSDQTKRELRIVFLGMTGVGKSSSANTVIGREHFKADCDGSSITYYCKHANAKVQGRDVVVVDTPGLFDTRQGNDETMREITRCVCLSAPGPHALVLVVRGGDRQTEQVQKCADIIMDVFGDHARRYMILLFTHRDDLEYHRQSLPQFVNTLPPKMKQVLQRCGDRYLAFNNRVRSSAEKDAQVKNLFAMIDGVVSQNGGRCFTNDVYKDFEKMIVARERKLKEKLEKQKEKELQVFQARVEKETQRQLQMLQEKQHEQAQGIQRMEHERQLERERERIEKEMNEKMDRKFREQEEKYKERMDNVRGEVRNEVQEDESGTGELIVSGLKALGKGIVSGAQKLFRSIFG